MRERTKNTIIASIMCASIPPIIVTVSELIGPRAELREMYNKTMHAADIDKDGTLSKSEIIRVYDQLGLQRLECGWYVWDRNDHLEELVFPNISYLEKYLEIIEEK